MKRMLMMSAFGAMLLVLAFGCVSTRRYGPRIYRKHPWVEEYERKLEEHRLTFHLKNMPMDAAVAAIDKLMSDVNVVWDKGDEDAPKLSLRGSKMKARDALAWMATLTGCSYYFADNAIHFTTEHIDYDRFIRSYCEETADSPKMRGKVTLSISAPSAVREKDYVVVRCLVVLDNRTNSELVVSSHFSSAFDGLSVRIMGEDEKVLGTTSCILHQSPSSDEPGWFSLPLGKSKRELSFFSDVIPKNVQGIQIQVVGFLPGSGYDRQVRSNVMTVDISKKKR